MSNPGVIAALIVALLGPLATYLVAARRLSGRIGSSEADSLWRESTAIRDWATKRIEELNRELAICRERMDRLELRNEALTKENGNLKHMLEEHEQTIDTLRAEVRHLRAENTGLKAANELLVGRVTELEAQDESS